VTGRRAEQARRGAELNCAFEPADQCDMRPRRPGSVVKAPRTSSGRPKVAGLVGLGLVALLGLVAGLSGALIFAGLYVLGTGVWAVFRRGSWLGKSSRRTGAWILAGGLVLVVAGSAVAGPVADKAPAESSPAESSPAGSVVSSAAPQTALAAVSLLEVKGRAPKTGYDRDLFGSGWVDVDRNGCDTRNDVLARDLESETFKAGTNDCVVLTGTLADPYSATTIGFVRGNETSSAVQIDHVVALSDAWQKGAQAWAEARRVSFANDPMNLLAVDGPLNMQKGDGDAATWLPPNKAYRCEYVARQVGVKYTYGLWVTDAERNAMVSVLSTCPNQALPDGSTLPPAPAPDVYDKN
jgi:hypothetical protein